MNVINKNFSRKKSTRVYTKDDLVRAVDFFLSNEKDFSLSFVAKLFNIPYQTLSDNIARRKLQKLADHTNSSCNHLTSLETDIIKGTY